MRVIPALFMLCLCAPAMAATYRWVDENGQVHYSDRPREGAQEVQLGGAQTYSSPTLRPRARRAPAATPSGTSAAAPAYDSLIVVRPGQGQTYRNIGGQLAVTLTLAPALRRGHSIRVYYDGQPIGDWPPTALSFTLGNVYRGEHNIRAVVVDAGDRQLVSSETVTFYVHQRSAISGPAR